ncbi:transcriptional regulator [Kitasatospora sp. NPDC048365]|uniref:transcriptional regulator n=1 Tax=Kitasatospora sp. NPDC048365 TaxID=3364050 RepID=UPI00370FD14A
MARQTGNIALKSARNAAGLSSQKALLVALRNAALELGLGDVSISPRQVARWESATPGWPRSEYQKLLVHVLRLPVERLGFRPPWASDTPAIEDPVGAPARVRSSATAIRSGGAQPDTIGADYAVVTDAHRRMYWSVSPATLHQAVAEHANLGSELLNETRGVARRILATALAESLLLCGRIQFFDLRQPEQADGTYLRALQAAGEADDALLGAAILAHIAFVPGWQGRRADAQERMQAARTYARRAPASTELLAWLDAVEAECLTRCGDHQGALRLIWRAEELLADGADRPASPSWMTWFSANRLAAFKGNTELAAGHLPQARTTLQGVLEALPAKDGKQRVVVLADLATVEATAGRISEACALLGQALDQLDLTWYATGMERVREARRTLTEWSSDPQVQRLDDRLYSWSATVSSLQR